MTQISSTNCECLLSYRLIFSFFSSLCGSWHRSSQVWTLTWTNCRKWSEWTSQPAIIILYMCYILYMSSRTSYPPSFATIVSSLFFKSRRFSWFVCLCCPLQGIHHYCSGSAVRAGDHVDLWLFPVWGERDDNDLPIHHLWQPSGSDDVRLPLSPF